MSLKIFSKQKDVNDFLRNKKDVSEIFSKQKDEFFRNKKILIKFSKQEDVNEFLRNKQCQLIFGNKKRSLKIFEKQKDVSENFLETRRC